VLKYAALLTYLHAYAAVAEAKAGIGAWLDFYSFYAKPPFSGPEAVLAYLARYTHRVAIANSRLIALDERGVTFRYKDYRRNGQARYRTMILSADEFIRRFLLHVLPKGFIASAITGCWRADNRHLKFSAVQPAIAFASL